MLRLRLATYDSTIPAVPLDGSALVLMYRSDVLQAQRVGGSVFCCVWVQVCVCVYPSAAKWCLEQSREVDGAKVKQYLPKSSERERSQEQMVSS